jgi:hypothetical protein
MGATKMTARDSRLCALIARNTRLLLSARISWGHWSARQRALYDTAADPRRIAGTLVPLLPLR